MNRYDRMHSIIIRTTASYSRTGISLDLLSQSSPVNIPGDIISTAKSLDYYPYDVTMVSTVSLTSGNDEKNKIKQT
jgi:hypothetical protein